MSGDGESEPRDVDLAGAGRVRVERPVRPAARNRPPELAVRLVSKPVVWVGKLMLRSPKGKDLELLPQARSRNGLYFLIITGTGND